MKIIITVVVLIGLLLLVKFVYSRANGKANLKRLVKNSQDAISTDEDIYRALMTAVAMNGEEFETLEEIEKDLDKKQESMETLNHEGFGSENYNRLSDTRKRIYLIVNGYDLDLIPEFLQAKALSCITQA